MKKMQKKNKIIIKHLIFFVLISTINFGWSRFIGQITQHYNCYDKIIAKIYSVNLMANNVMWKFYSTNKFFNSSERENKNH